MWAFSMIGRTGQMMGAHTLFRWLGAAGIELQSAGQVLAIDPYFTRLPFRRQLFGRVAPDGALVATHMPRCDVVLVTHAHYDHLLDVPEVARNTGARVYGSGNTCGLLRALGVPEGQIRQVGAGDALSLGAFQVQVLPAVHRRTPGFGPGRLSSDLRPPLRARDYRMDSALSFLIAAQDVRLLTDPGGPLHVEQPVDLLLLAPHLGPGRYGPILCAAHPKTVIPSHWDDFWRPLSKPLRPMLCPPRWALPPLRRVNLAAFCKGVEQIVPGTVVFVPEVLRVYDVMAEALGHPQPLA